MSMICVFTLYLTDLKTITGSLYIFVVKEKKKKQNYSLYFYKNFLFKNIRLKILSKVRIIWGYNFEWSDIKIIKIYEICKRMDI